MDLTAPLDTLDATGVTGMIERLRELGGPVDEAEAIDEIAALERLKSAAAAAQARVTAALREGRVAREMDAGMPAAERAAGWGTRSAWRAVRARPSAPDTSVWPARSSTSCPAPWHTSLRGR